MIEKQYISKVIYDGVCDFTLPLEYFLHHKNEMLFIINHYKNYKNIPSVETFKSRFHEFELIKTRESMEFLSKSLKDNYNYDKIIKIVDQFQNTLVKDVDKAIMQLKNNINTLDISPSIGYTDIIKEGEKRLNTYLNKKDNEVLITTGFPEIDEFLGGFERTEELVTIFARTNVGKSWVLDKILMEIWKTGKNVCLYSGEMSDNAVGYRFDTLYKGFSNSQLMRGGSEQVYVDYIKNLSGCENGFNVYTKTNATVEDLRIFVEKCKPDVLGVDQYSLMSDISKARDERDQLANITKDLFNLSCEYNIPVIGVHQANRNATKFKDKSPEIEDLRSSDAISHNSSKIFSLAETGAGITIAIKKNRHGKKDAEFVYYWDIDRGKFIKPNENSKFTKEELDDFQF